MMKKILFIVGAVLFASQQLDGMDDDGPPPPPPMDPTWKPTKPPTQIDKPEEPVKPSQPGEKPGFQPPKPGQGVSVNPLDIPANLFSTTAEADAFRKDVVAVSETFWKKQTPNDKPAFVAMYFLNKDAFVKAVHSKKSDLEKSPAKAFKTLREVLRHTEKQIDDKLKELMKQGLSPTKPTGPEVLNENTLMEELRAMQNRDFAMSNEKELKAMTAKKAYNDIKAKYKDKIDSDKIDGIYKKLKDAGWKTSTSTTGPKQPTPLPTPIQPVPPTIVPQPIPPTTVVKPPVNVSSGDTFTPLAKALKDISKS